MRKLSTASDLLVADMKQGRALFDRYRKSSSLPTRELKLNQPRLNYRRDRVLKKIIYRDIEFARKTLLRNANPNAA